MPNPITRIDEPGQVVTVAVNIGSLFMGAGGELVLSVTQKDITTYLNVPLNDLENLATAITKLLPEARALAKKRVEAN